MVPRQALIYDITLVFNQRLRCSTWCAKRLYVSLAISFISQTPLANDLQNGSMWKKPTVLPSCTRSHSQQIHILRDLNTWAKRTTTFSCGFAIQLNQVGVSMFQSLRKGAFFICACSWLLIESRGGKTRATETLFRRQTPWATSPNMCPCL